MTDALKKFLTSKEVLALVDENKYLEVFERAIYGSIEDQALSIHEGRAMVEFFENKLGINPLEYMNRIPQGYFYDVNLTTVNIPEGVKTFDDYAFDRANIASLRLPSTLKGFSEDAFSDSNIAVICLPYSTDDYINLVDIDAYAGAYNGAFKLADSTGKYIEHLTIPASANAIKYSSHFQDCTSIKKITFEEGVDNIPPHALSGCHYLTTVEIPRSMQVIGNNAFDYCINVEKIIYNGTYENFADIQFGKDWLSNGDDSEHYFELVCTDGTYTEEAHR